MELKIITSNIRYDDPKDGTHQWNNRLFPWLECINSFTPDLLGTQEGLHPQILTISTSLKNLILADQHRNWCKNRMFPNIFYNPDIFDRIFSGDIWLSETPGIAESISFGSKFPRLVTWAFFELKHNKKRIFVANTHLDFHLGHTRIKQAEVLIAEISKLECFDKNLVDSIVLMGDFNEGPDDGVQAYFMKSFKTLYDPWKSLQMSEIGTHHKFDGNNLNNKRIDWILLSNDLKTKEMNIDTCKYNDIYPSDHFPVKLKINF